MTHLLEIAAAFSFLSAVVSAALFVIALRAYLTTRDAAMGFLAGAFTVFGLKSLLVGYAILTGFVEHTTLEFVDAVGDLCTILLIVLPILLPRPRGP